MASTAVAPAEVGVKVGDFFVASWGYDQTNVDFYRVVGLTPKGVKVQKWQSAMAPSQPSHPSTEYVVPGEGPAIGANVKAPGAQWAEWDRYATAPVRTKRLHPGYSGRACFSVSSYANAYHWDGTPESQTGWGFGH